MNVYYTQVTTANVDGKQDPNDAVQNVTPWSCVLVRAENFAQAASKIEELYPTATDWRIERIGNLQAMNLSDKWMNRPLTDAEVDQAKAESAGRGKRAN